MRRASCLMSVPGVKGFIVGSVGGPDPARARTSCPVGFSLILDRVGNARLREGPQSQGARVAPAARLLAFPVTGPGAPERNVEGFPHQDESKLRECLKARLLSSLLIRVIRLWSPAGHRFVEFG